MHAVQFLIVKMIKNELYIQYELLFYMLFLFHFGYEMDCFVIGSVETIHRNQTVRLAISCCS